MHAMPDVDLLLHFDPCPDTCAWKLRGPGAPTPMRLWDPPPAFVKQQGVQGAAGELCGGGIVFGEPHGAAVVEGCGGHMGPGQPWAVGHAADGFWPGCIPYGEKPPPCAGSFLSTQPRIHEQAPQNASMLTHTLQNTLVEAGKI